MRPSGVLALSLVGCLVVGLGAALWLWGGAPPASDETAELATDVERSESAPRAADLDPDDVDRDHEDEVELDATDVGARSGLEASPIAAPNVPLGPSAKVKGFVHDEATHEPLPAFLLRIHDRAHHEDVVTDEQGRFESTTAFLEGRLRVDPLDDARRRRPAPSRQVDLVLEEGVARELDLAVPCGPTYELAIEPKDAPIDALRGMLVVADEEKEERDRLGGEIVHAGDPPWVRFGAVDARFDHAERLELRSTDGVWRGDAVVNAVRGVQSKWVTVKLDAMASLLGRVLGEGGGTIAHARVELREVNPGARERRRDTMSDDDGNYRFDFVRPASYVVVASTLRHQKSELPVTLAAKDVKELELALVLKPPAGDIRGEIVTLTGTTTPKATMTLAPSGGDRTIPALQVGVNWTTVDGRKVGRFEFLALPEGPFTLRVEKDDWLKWEPRQTEVRAPRDDVKIVVNDDLATCDYAVRARDRDNGLVLDKLRVWIEFVDGPQRERRVASNEPIERGVPLERRFRWRIDRAGYRSEKGDEKSFAIEEHVDGKIRRVMELDMTPGWGDVVRAVRRDGRGPIEGVEVFADGRSVGKTAKDGTLRVELKDPPTKLEATHPTWTMTGQADLRPAWKRDERKFVILRFNPKPKQRG